MIIMHPKIKKVSSTAKIPIPGMSNEVSKNHVIPPINNPSKAAYVQIRTGLVDCEKITMSTVINPPIAPMKIKGEDWGIEKAVAIAVIAVISSKIPVFSETPSIVIKFDSASSHQFLLL